MDINIFHFFGKIQFIKEFKFMDNQKEKSEIEIDGGEFQIVFEMIKEIGQQERHFNNLSGVYKTMASTWLLSIFIGIGFIVMNKVEPQYLFIAGVGFAGGIGIFLLWLMDLRVYQQLLAANFVERINLEKKYKWLPQAGHNMIKTQATGTVISNLSWFYILGVLIPLVVGGLSFMKYIINFSFLFTIFLSAILAILLTFLIKTLISTSEEENLKEYLNRTNNTSLKRLYFFIGIIFFLGFVAINLDFILKKINQNNQPSLETIQLKDDYDYLAPDSSEIRLLSSVKYGGVAHCVLPPRKVSIPVKHKTVEEIWYVLEGKGEMWRKNEKEEKIIQLSKGTSLTIPTGTSFQFRNTARDSLKILIATMPPWPGGDEAVKVNGRWKIK